MAAKKSTPAFDFLVEQLKKNKAATYGDLAAAAQKKGHKIFPIMYGRAKAMLGLVKTSPRGSGKASRRKAAKTTVAKRGPGRPRGSKNKVTRAPRAPMSGIESIVSQVKATEADRERLRGALERIRSIIDDVM